MSTHQSCEKSQFGGGGIHGKVLHEKFHRGEGYSFLGKVLPKGPKSSMRNSSSVGSILGKILPKVPKSFIRSSISGVWGGLFFAKNTLFCVILTTLLSHWARLCITDNPTNYQLQLKGSLLVTSPSFYPFNNINSRILDARSFWQLHFY